MESAAGVVAEDQGKQLAGGHRRGCDVFKCPERARLHYNEWYLCLRHADPHIVTIANYLKGMTFAPWETEIQNALRALIIKE